MTNKNCIAIPIYTKTPSKCDKLSISSLKNIKDIRDWDIFIIYPKQYDFELKNNWAPIFSDFKYTLMALDNKWFASEKSYSKLLRSNDFWLIFKIYEYMLIFQTDGYCVECTLSDWTVKHYDFIGAPIIASNANWMKVPAIGNGGVSLRKIQTFIDITDPNGECMKTIKNDVDEFNKSRNYIYDQYEDLYFCELINKYWDLDIARQDDAFNFAWDMNVDIVYEMRNHRLPCFLHAWTKNIRFWQNQLDVFNDFDIINECEKKYDGTYLGKNGQYQANIPHKNSISIGVVCCVKNENWHIYDKCRQWLNQGFDKVILIDNNEITDEPVTKHVNMLQNVEVIENKYRDKETTSDYDLISEMYSDAYNNYTAGLDYIMLLDADEELHFDDENDSIFRLAYDLQSHDNMNIAHIPVTIIDVNNNKSKYQANKHKSLIKTGLDITKFTREGPICPYSAAPYSSLRVSVYNHTTYDSYDNYKKYKEGRGYPDMPIIDSSKMTDEKYFYKINPNAINQSTIMIGQ